MKVMTPLQKSTLAERVYARALAGAGEGSTELLQSMFSNLTASQTYDLTRSILNEGALDEAGVGFILGMLLGGGKPKIANMQDAKKFQQTAKLLVDYQRKNNPEKAEWLEGSELQALADTPVLASGLVPTGEVKMIDPVIQDIQETEALAELLPPDEVVVNTQSDPDAVAQIAEFQQAKPVEDVELSSIAESVDAEYVPIAEVTGTPTVAYQDVEVVRVRDNGDYEVRSAANPDAGMWVVGEADMVVPRDVDIAQEGFTAKQRVLITRPNSKGEYTARSKSRTARGRKVNASELTVKSAGKPVIYDVKATKPTVTTKVIPSDTPQGRKKETTVSTPRGTAVIQSPMEQVKDAPVGVQLENVGTQTDTDKTYMKFNLENGSVIAGEASPMLESDYTLQDQKEIESIIDGQLAVRSTKGATAADIAKVAQEQGVPLPDFPVNAEDIATTIGEIVDNYLPDSVKEDPMVQALASEMAKQDGKSPAQMDIAGLAFARRAAHAVLKGVHRWAESPFFKVVNVGNRAIYENFTGKGHKKVQEGLKKSLEAENKALRTMFRTFGNLTPTSSTWSDTQSGIARDFQGDKKVGVEQTWDVMEDFYKSAYALLMGVDPKDLNKVSLTQLRNQPLLQLSLAKVRTVLDPDFGLAKLAVNPVEGINPYFDALTPEQKAAYSEGLSAYLKYTRYVHKDVLKTIEDVYNQTSDITEVRKAVKANHGMGMQTKTVEKLLKEIIEPYQSLAFEEVTLPDGSTMSAQEVIQNVDDNKADMQTLTTAEVKMAAAIRKMNDIIHTRNFELGLITEEDYERHKGTYIMRGYIDDPILSEVEATDLNVDKPKRFRKKASGKSSPNTIDEIYGRRDIYEIVDFGLDPNLDPVEATMERLSQMRKAEAVLEYAYTLSEMGVASDVPKPGYRKLGDIPLGDEDKRRLRKPFGVLTGKWVPKDVAQDFEGYFYMDAATQAAREVVLKTARIPLVRLTAKALTVWKPAIHLGNYTGNFVMAMGAGIPPIGMFINRGKAKTAMVERNALYYEAASKGIFGKSMDNFLTPTKKGFDDIALRREFEKSQKSILGAMLSYIQNKDVPDYVKKGMRDELNKKRKDAKGIMGIVAKNRAAYNFFTKVSKTARYADLLAQHIYQKEDDIAKLSAFITLRDMGYTPDQAAERIGKGMQMYHRTGINVDTLSKVPFFGKVFKFGADYTRMAYNKMANYPLTYMSWAVGMGVLERTMSSLAGESEEEREARLASGNFKRLPFLNRIPYAGKYLDVPLEWVVPIPKSIDPSGKGLLDVARFLSPMYNFEMGTQSQAEGNLTGFVMDFLDLASPIGFKETDNKSPLPIIPYAGTDPVFGLFYSALFADEDFRGVAISDRTKNKFNPEGTLSRADRMTNTGIYIARGIVPFFREGHDLYLSAMYGEDYYGRVLDIKDAISRQLGVRTSSYIDNYTIDQRIERQARAIGYEISAKTSSVNVAWKNLERQVNDYTRLLNEGSLTQEQFDRNINKGVRAFADKMDEAYTELAEYKLEIESYLQSIAKYKIESLDQFNDAVRKLEETQQKSAGYKRLAEEIEQIRKEQREKKN